MASKSPRPEAAFSPQAIAPAATDSTIVTVTGRLIEDPELRSDAGVPMSRLQISTTGTEGVLVVGAVLSDSLATAAGEHLVKGSRVQVDGYLRGRRWIDDKGVGCYDVDLIATALATVPAKAA